jgi:hypothetical protein
MRALFECERPRASLPSNLTSYVPVDVFRTDSGAIWYLYGDASALSICDMEGVSVRTAEEFFAVQIANKGLPCIE